jgi:cell wall-associated NlpC family hydrolase
MPRSLRAGDSGPDVLALQNALHRALGSKAKNNRRGSYGSLTVADVHLFKLPWQPEAADGHVFGTTAWAHLAKFLSRQDKALLRKAQELDAAREAESHKQKIRGAIVAEAYWMLAHAGLYTYRQFRPMPPSIRDPIAHDRLDCSSTVTLLYKAGGAVDPNGRGYDGQGYTGTLVSHGASVAVPAPTDLCFYGNMGNGIPSHVAICVEPGWLFSFGHTPPSKYPVGYRTDYRGARRYSVT